MNTLFAKRTLPALLFTGAVSLMAAGGCGSGNGTSSIPGNYVLPTPTPTATPTPTPSASPTPAPTDGPETTRGAYQDLRYTFTVPKHNYAVGEIVPMTFTIQNTGTAEVTLENVSNSFVDAAIQTPEGQNVSAVGSTDVTATKKATTRTQIYDYTIPAGQTRTFSLTWDQTRRFFTPDGNPTQAAPGNYVLTGEISPARVNGTSESGLPAPSITITIQQ